MTKYHITLPILISNSILTSTCWTRFHTPPDQTLRFKSLKIRPELQPLCLWNLPLPDLKPERPWEADSGPSVSSCPPRCRGLYDHGTSTPQPGTETVNLVTQAGECCPYLRRRFVPCDPTPPTLTKVRSGEGDIFVMIPRVDYLLEYT